MKISIQSKSKSADSKKVIRKGQKNIEPGAEINRSGSTVDKVTGEILVEFPLSVNRPPKSLKQLQELVGYQFNNPEILCEAMTHSSATKLFSVPFPNNQRLEFLGDAVLQLVMSTFLFTHFDDADEGLLTKSRAHLVNKEGIYERAIKLELGEYIIMSRSEELNGGRERLTSVADAFESLVGAIHLDGGFDAAEKFTKLAYADIFEDPSEIPVQINPKGELQEFLQCLGPSDPPRYEMTNTFGHEHDKVFECVVRHEGIELSKGTGRSKKAAEIQAAERAIEYVWDHMSCSYPRLPQ